MSDNADWTLIVRASQQAKVAAEAAVASARLLESEAGNRLASVEARLGSIEARIANLTTGQAGHELAIMRIADTQADHTARLTRIEARLDRIEGGFARTEVLLAAIAQKLDVPSAP